MGQWHNTDPFYCCTEGNTDICQSATFKLPAIFVTLLQFANFPPCAHNLIQVSVCASIYITCILKTPFFHFRHIGEGRDKNENEKEEGVGKGLISCWCNSSGQLALSSFSILPRRLFWCSNTKRHQTEIKSNGCLKARPAALCNVQLQSSTSYNKIQLV